METSKKIQKLGVGPGEYSLLYDFNINPFTKELELLNPRGELLSYTIDGEFIKSQRIPMRNASKFIPITEDTIIFYHYCPINLLDSQLTSISIWLSIVIFWF